MKIVNTYIVITIAVILLWGCREGKTKNHGPIVLGDSSKIVTERDTKKLMDLVNDLQPDIPPATSIENTDTNKTKQDTSKKAVAVAPVQPTIMPISANSLKTEFKETTILIPGLSAKLSGNTNLHNANGAVYTWESGAIAGNILKISGNIIRVYQKYQSVVILKCKLGSLPLEALMESTSWEQLKGGSDGYPVSGLDEASLSYPKANINAIKNAVSKACNKKHINRKKAEEWISYISHLKAANQKPLTVTLRSVMWKIDGKDEKGRLFSKQIRIDVPM